MARMRSEAVISPNVAAKLRKALSLEEVTPINEIGNIIEALSDKVLSLELRLELLEGKLSQLASINSEFIAFTQEKDLM